MEITALTQTTAVVVPAKAKHWTIREGEKGILHLKLLGRGVFGEVHELSDAETGTTFARKVICVLRSVTTDDVENEMRALKKLRQNQHPNIVQVFEYGVLNPDSTFHFIDMELCDINLGNYLLGHELKEVVSWATVRNEDEVPMHAYNILQQILHGLLFIHCLGEVHRDLSPQNVLFRNGGWKIAEFGVTSLSTHLVTNPGHVTPCYRSPELLEGAESDKADMWSFGCIAYELFTGKTAFRNTFETWQYGMNKRSPKMYFKGLDDVTKHFSYGLLEVDPEKRPSARMLLEETSVSETSEEISDDLKSLKIGP